MLVRFFEELRAEGVPVSITEFLTLHEALDRRVVGHDHVSWVQRLVIDPASESCALSVVPDVGVIPVTCSGTFGLHAADGDQCLRTLDAELKIKVPIIGSRAEKSLAPGIMRRLDLEAEALDTFLTR